MELISVNTAQDRTILFDLLPLRTIAFRSYELRFQVIAVPGQRLYSATRKMLLKGADTFVFVANSAADRFQENLQSLKEMTENLLSHGINPSSLPVVFQYNKRDLPDTTEIKTLDRALNARSSESFPSIAIEEEGVLETFAAALRLTMTELSTRYKIGEDVRGPRHESDLQDGATGSKRRTRTRPPRGWVLRQRRIQRQRRNHHPRPCSGCERPQRLGPSSGPPRRIRHPQTRRTEGWKSSMPWPTLGAAYFMPRAIEPKCCWRAW